MTKRNFWDGLQVAGALASIVGLVTIIGTTPGLSIALVFIVAGGVVAVVVASVNSRHAPQLVGRNAMTDTGRRLIRNVKSEAVMFGGDMSWAGDYEEAIRSVTSSGKRVRVLYPQSSAAKVSRNVQILREAGAHLIATHTDSGLRALLVDPEDPKDTLLFVATRRLRKGALPVETGDRGMEGSYEYHARIYTMDREWVMIQAVKSVYAVLGRDH